MNNGWAYTIDHGRQTPDGSRDMISIRHPDRSGVLKIQAIRAPGPVDRETLRAMTNVESSEDLEWKAWGDFFGYQHSYSENGVFYQQWWLTNDVTIVFFVHSAMVELGETGQREIDKIVLSIIAN